MPDLVAVLLAAFLPLFVAINIPGILPLYIGMTETFTADDRRQLLVRALAAALVLAVLMLFAGQVIFDTLGITLNDLRVGGGIILLVIAVTDLAFGDTKGRRGGEKEDRERVEAASASAERGRPCPSCRSASRSSSGRAPSRPSSSPTGSSGGEVTLLSIALNMLLVFVVFTFGPALLRLFGPGHLEGRREGGEPVPGGHLGGDDPRRRDRDAGRRLRRAVWGLGPLATAPASGAILPTAHCPLPTAHCR